MRPFRSGRAGRRRALACFLFFMLAFCLPDSPVFAQKGKIKGGNKGGKKRLKASPDATAGGSPGEQSLADIPLPVGHDAKGLVLPDFDLEGHLRGRFVAGGARRLDQEQVAFTELKITTFTPESQTDLQIDLHTAIFNLKTKILNSKERSTVQRADFNIIGDSLSFDTDKRTGTMVGHVKMVITSNSKLIEKGKETP
jgi:hypothetical protein